MFTFNELTQVHLEISNNCQASCPMCSRNINGGGINPLIFNRDWTLEQFKIIMNPEVLTQINGFYLCGTFGDPMMNNDLLDMCRYAKEIKTDIRIHMHTNGGARKAEWWAELAKVLPADHMVTFGLDGLADTNHLYRVGTNFDTIIRNAKSFIAAGGQAEWAFIKFKHNEHQVEEAQQLAKSLGFARFNLKASSRFIIEPRVKVVDRQGEITHYIEPSTDTPMKFIDKKAIDNYKQIVKDAAIECQVLKTKEVYIDAYGDLYACCWLANTPYTHISEDASFEVRKKIKQQHKNMVAHLGEVNTLKRSIKDIIDSPEYQNIWTDMWEGENKNIICARSCGKHLETEISKCSDQFLEIISLDE
jgi:MoaA/NifB/PqqE/SkfB family radical SAM enzyme